ncbi:ABC transporter permease [Nocardioides yefusunii]|uniref:Transport permease protein n=1 Tax=Nocardioides yefusunii TaxID=2500546 RepID=A0ABW1R1F8_9ACTN|nr:ABC transporter permease [Nocardioides yefusunii]
MSSVVTDEQDLPPLAPPAPGGGLFEVFRQRYLLKTLVKNTLQSSYQGTFLGWLWSYVQPGIRFAIYYFLFQVMMARGGEDLPNFAIHMVCGMVMVHFFTEAFSGGTQSLLRSRRLLSKLPMPKALFPVAKTIVALWHTFPMLVILVVIDVLVGWRPDMVGIGAGLLGFAILLPLGLALAMFFSILNVFWRDFGKLIGTITQLVTFSVPMIYPFTFITAHGETWTQAYLLNPVAEAVLLMQRCFWVGSTHDPAGFTERHMPSDLWERGFVMLAVSLLMLALATLWFKKYEARVVERL